ncbi:type VII secretion target [Goodfellowiella coeruleoviolacea]|uniref:Excreted virulence factor EspC, type VII ESX diderm n=1 Tax=Goodfellowiella coeruleoviolacea TaxID=334858 RepID=A0AAE3KI06_9PSEU|nr:type VII secretion target [Goodfellowiella coeruleoviolacea]MCP2167452.1 Excreted virulence factor EspC, type VII ESX diderm [Goodfellowiella coeruleoviolacea]
MAAGGYSVVPEALRSHGSHLDGLVDRLNTAVDAARIASMSEDSYGLLCAFLPPIINPVEEKAADALAAAVEGVSTLADGARDTATAYDDQETAHQDTMTALRTQALGGAS